MRGFDIERASGLALRRDRTSAPSTPLSSPLSRSSRVRSPARASDSSRLIINAAMLGITAWVAGWFDLAFDVDGFIAALLGAIVISLVSTALSLWADEAILRPATEAPHTMTGSPKAAPARFPSRSYRGPGGASRRSAFAARCAVRCETRNAQRSADCRFHQIVIFCHSREFPVRDPIRFVFKRLPRRAEVCVRPGQPNITEVRRVHVTESACEALSKLLGRAGPERCLRLSTVQGNYRFIVDEPIEQDILYRFDERVVLAVSDTVSRDLWGITVDCDQDEGKRKLIFRKAQAGEPLDSIRDDARSSPKVARRRTRASARRDRGHRPPDRIPAWRLKSLRARSSTRSKPPSRRSGTRSARSGQATAVGINSTERRRRRRGSAGRDARRLASSCRVAATIGSMYDRS